MAASCRFRIFAFCLAVTLGFIPGCGDDETPPCPPVNVGRIHGMLQAAGQPIHAHVTAYAVPEDSHPGDAAYVQTLSDSSGAYSMEVPSGRYLLLMDASICYQFYAHGRLVSPSEAETLVVGRGESIAADVTLGAARLEVTTPAELEGYRCTARLVASTPEQCRSTSGNARITDGHATITFPRVIPGTYRMSFIVASVGEIWLPGTMDITEADSIVVPMGVEAQYQATLPQPATLRGTVTGSWQELGQYPPRLTLTDLTGRDQLASTQTNSVDGSYEMPVYGSGQALLQIAIGSVRRWHGGTTFDEATPIDLESGRTVELNLRESGVAGWLNREGLPSGVTLLLVDDDGAMRGTGSADGPRGFFRISNLVPGTYYLHIPAGPTWIEQYYDKTNSLALATPIQITEDGEVVWLNLDLENGGSIEGRLMRDDGAPAYGVPIDLVGPSGTQPFRRGQSNGQEGGFTFSALPDGDYRIVAHPNEIDMPVWYPGVTDTAQAVVISIRDHAEVTGIFFDLP